MSNLNYPEARSSGSWEKAREGIGGLGGREGADALPIPQNTEEQPPAALCLLLTPEFQGGRGEKGAFYHHSKAPNLCSCSTAACLVPHCSRSAGRHKEVGAWKLS